MRARCFWWPLQHKSSLIFRFRRKSRTKRGLGDLSSEGLVLLARHAHFLSYVHSVWQAWHFRNILRSKIMLFCMTGAGHRTLFHPRGRRGTLCTLLKRWVKIIGHFVWQAQYLVNVYDVLPGSKIAFSQPVVKLCLWKWWWFRVAGAAPQMPCAHFSWRAQYFVDLDKKSSWDLGKTSFLTFSMFIFRGARNLLWKSNMCTCNLLITLCASGRSHCGAVRSLRSLAQPCRHFGPVRSLSLWRGAHFERACATLSSFWASQIALVVAWCSFWNGLRNPLVILGLSDRSRCGMVRISRSLMQPSRHFGRVRSLSLWRGAHFDSQGDLVQSSWQRGLLQRAWAVILP